MSLSRRGLFGLFSAALASRFMPSTAEAFYEPCDFLVTQTATVTRYHGYEILDLTPADIQAAAEYDWMPALQREVA